MGKNSCIISTLVDSILHHIEPLLSKLAAAIEQHRASKSLEKDRSLRCLCLSPPTTATRGVVEVEPRGAPQNSEHDSDCQVHNTCTDEQFSSEKSFGCSKTVSLRSNSKRSVSAPVGAGRNSVSTFPFARRRSLTPHNGTCRFKATVPPPQPWPPQSASPFVYGHNAARGTSTTTAPHGCNVAPGTTSLRRVPPPPPGEVNPFGKQVVRLRPSPRMDCRAEINMF